MARYRQSERMARYRKRKRAGFPVVVSEGDSWFSYEFFPNIIDIIDDEEMFAHLRLEMSGDTVANMVGNAESVEGLRGIVEEEEALFLLFSGGGNDIQQSASTLFQSATAPEDCIKADVADRLFSGLRIGYENLISAVGPHAPVVSHGYDHFLPSDEPVRALGIDIHIGPWIHPEMEAAGITDPGLQRDIALLLVDRFNQDLASLQAAHPKDFVYVDLRGTLRPELDWENEIHPTRHGFNEVTKKILEAVYGRVRQLLVERR